MPADRIEDALAVVALLCVLTIFFFPAVEGPYCAVHGPVTALLSIRASAALRGGLHRSHPAQARRVPSVLSFMESATNDLAASGASILRC